MMRKMFPAILAVVIALGAVVPVVIGGGTASACMGRTPGYWKNHTELWDDMGAEEVLPGDSFEGVFGVDVPGVGPEMTILQALQTGGGKWTALNRHAAAALLNSYAFPYPDFYYTEDVIEMVQDAYDSGDWESAKDTLEYANEYAEG